MPDQGRAGFDAFRGGLIVVRDDRIERGKTYQMGHRLFVGTGLLRGVAYSVPGKVERGYVLDYRALAVRLLDAVTGCVVAVRPHDCIEVDPRYRGDWTREEAFLHAFAQ